MAVGVRLETKLQTKLALTPELKTALELLQLPILELEQRIEQEVAENPLLEWDEAPAPLSDAEIIYLRGRIEGTDFARDTQADDFDLSEHLVAAERGLHAHLQWQVGVAPWEDSVKTVAYALIPRIGPDGYLRESDAELASMVSSDLPAVAAARRALQTLEPVGVAARNLAECLLLQLQERGEGNGLAARILAEACDLLAAGDLTGIARRLGVGSGEVRAALAELRHLDPQPGAAYRNDTSDPIQPEIAIEPNGDGWRVVPYRPYSRRIRRSPLVQRLRENPGSFSKEERAFLREKLRSAEYFLSSLKQRDLTLIRVTEAIVARQSEMLSRGPLAAQPLTLKEIAADVGLHESTISRVTQRKYAITPHGIWELKDFFRHAVGGDHTADDIKQKIAALIAAEPKHNPLSDQAIADALKKQGIDVARRTVAKYRTEMNIPTRSERRAQPDA